MTVYGTKRKWRNGFYTEQLSSFTYLSKRHKSWGIDRLVSLGSALVAGVSGDLHHGFDLGGFGDYASDSDEFPHFVSFHISNRRQFLSLGSLEMDFETTE